MLSPTTAFVESLEIPELVEPGADWRRADEYPQLQPPKDWTEGDPAYLRLVWEFLRRSPRYRWHHLRLARDGLLDEDRFKGVRPFLSSDDRIGLPGWRALRADQHYTNPAAASGETLGQYVDRQDGAWLIVHGTWYAKSLWGISEVIDPRRRAESLDLHGLFAPNLPEIVGALDRAEAGDWSRKTPPVKFRTVLSPREVLIRVRLDMPPAEQDKLIDEAMTKARMRLRIPSKNKRIRAAQSKAPLLLRIWDAHRAAGGSPLSRKPLQDAFWNEADALPPALANKIVARKPPNAVTFKTQVKSWAMTGFHKLLPEAKTLIESEEGEHQLAEWLSAGLRFPGAFAIEKKSARG